MERMQKRALRIIQPDLSYAEALVAVDITSLGTFRFYDEEDNEYEFSLPVFSENTKEVYNPYA